MPVATNGGAQQTPRQPVEAPISRDFNILGAAARQRPQTSPFAQPAVTGFGSQQTAQQRVQALPFQRSAVPVLAQRTVQQPMQASPFGHIFATDTGARAEAQHPEQASQYPRSDGMNDIQPTARQPVQPSPFPRSSMTSHNGARGNDENRDPSARPMRVVSLEESRWATPGPDVVSSTNGIPLFTGRDDSNVVRGQHGITRINPGSLQYFPARRAAE